MPAGVHIGDRRLLEERCSGREQRQALQFLEAAGYANMSCHTDLGEPFIQPKISSFQSMLESALCDTFETSIDLLLKRITGQTSSTMPTST